MKWLSVTISFIVFLGFQNQECNVPPGLRSHLPQNHQGEEGEGLGRGVMEEDARGGEISGLLALEDVAREQGMSGPSGTWDCFVHLFFVAFECLVEECSKEIMVRLCRAILIISTKSVKYSPKNVFKCNRNNTSKESGSESVL